MSTEKPIIEEIYKTCEACPSQWQGKLETGEYVYIRYRWGVLSIGYDADYNNAVLQNKVTLSIGGDYDGTMSSSEMIKHLLPYVSFGGLG